MKYPNPLFTGMGQVTQAAINDEINNYYPNAKQKGGAKRLDLLNDVENLDGLINFCINGYRAWDDAVLMGAGAYLKISNYEEEISDAKQYAKEEVKNYLSGMPFASQADYDNWHKEICTNLSDCHKYFQNYSAYRKPSQDKFKNKYGFTIGNAQKFLNMLMKDLYTCLSKKNGSFNVNQYENYFTYCHMPLDSYILRFADDIRFRKNIKSQRNYTWSNLNDYDDYMSEQTEIRKFVAGSAATVLQTEFVVWPLYK